MKKIRLLTLLALMLGSIVPTQAQEKQNDATWEETISFLNKNISKLNIPGGTYLHSVNETKLEQFSDSRSNISRRVDLIELKSAKFTNSTNEGHNCKNFNQIKLDFTKNTVSIFLLDDEYYLENHFFIPLCGKYIDEPSCRCVTNLWNEQDIFIQRFLKAFKHLAYLANEKRKESKF